MLKLVHSTETPVAVAPKRPVLSLAALTPNPWCNSREQHVTPSGRLIPPLHRWDRIRIRTQHATKAWRDLGRSLDVATADLVACDPGDADRRLDAWIDVVKPILVSGDAKSDDLRCLLRLAAVLAGCREPMYARRGLDSSTAELALAALDHQIFRTLYQGDR